jgi:hypothetical protein
MFSLNFSKTISFYCVFHFNYLSLNLAFLNKCAIIGYQFGFIKVQLKKKERRGIKKIIYRSNPQMICFLMNNGAGNNIFPIPFRVLLNIPFNTVVSTKYTIEILHISNYLLIHKY